MFQGSRGSLPEGVVTFLFTDVEGSTKAWEKSPELMAQALEQHDEAINEAVTAHDGFPIKARGEGDSWFVVFASAVDAVAGAADVQRRLSEIDWVTSPGLVVRSSLHTGTGDLRDGDYYGPTVNRAARLRAIAHGGQTLLSDATYQLVRDQVPDGLAVVDMGDHGLKDLMRPEHVYQLNVDALPSMFPPLLSLNSVANNLPVQLTEFVGRESELTDVKRLLNENRLVTILAPGGSGKTRLAVQAAAESTHLFPDGAFFIGLADVTTGTDIVQSVTEALGLGLLTDDDPQMQLLTYLAGKRQLLVFDNFEHVREGAGLVSDVLRSGPDVTVMATSRVKLSVTGETVFNLSGLETTWQSPEDAFENSAVELFVDGARRADPAFEVSAENLEALAQILNLTGGLPLAILLAAAWVDMISVDEIAQEIEKSLDFLETDVGDVPDRHRSIRAVFDYSWSLLSSDEQETFAALSVFRGGFTREAAQQVTGASLRSIANLAGKSLLRPDPSSGRYVVHELLRQYAETELETNTQRCDEVQAAHAEYFANMTDGSFEAYARGEQQQTLDLVEADLDNIRTAWRRYVADRDAHGVLQMLLALAVVYEIRGWYPSGVSLFTEAIDAFSDDINDDSVLAREMARVARASLMTIVGRPDLGAAEAAEALENLPQSTDLMHRWFALETTAMGYAYLGDADAIHGVLQDWMDVFDSLDQKFWVNGFKNYLALAAFFTGDFEEANRLLAEAMAVFEQMNEHFFMTWALWIQGMIAMASDRPGDAVDVYSRQIRVSEEIRYLRGLVVGYEGLGDANLGAGRLDESEAAFIEGVRVSEQMGMTREVLNLMTKIAKLRAATGRGRESVELLAAVCGNPTSDQQPLAGDISIKEAATSVLTDLHSRLGAEEYDEAHTKGSEESFDFVLSELLGRGSDQVSVLS